MIVIDIPADLNMEDDLGRNFARTPLGRTFAPGDVAVAGRPDGWSWVLIDAADERRVHFHQVSANEAAARGPLTATA